ncbi:hypothetical protein KW850_32375 [Bacillus sp. sid0103]|uniref:hypothetical protein n=1 Tax=Bacillus sp. sid0103 TaxID=2856337 RepID=UPI001C43A79E|nr:hypothetical protein [Bacillus sp. sid0103]MBV7509776.1 hypothetical protein [Bacillus sp. sid0103]
MGKDFYAGIFSFIVGVLAIYMFFHATRERFLHNKTYDHIRYITPLPVSFNFWWGDFYVWLSGYTESLNHFFNLIVLELTGARVKRGLL